MACVENTVQRGKGGRREARSDVGGLGEGCSCEVVNMMGSGIYFEGRADSVS